MWAQLWQLSVCATGSCGLERGGGARQLVLNNSSSTHIISSNWRERPGIGIASLAMRPLPCTRLQARALIFAKAENDYSFFPPEISLSRASPSNGI